LNGHRTYGSKYEANLDGKIEPGRPENKRGAHCAVDNMNSKALGVCLVGNPGWDGYPTKKQLGALLHYLVVKCRQYGILVADVSQHSDHEPKKPHCASLDLHAIRTELANRLREVP
jgi:hypothetical protein